MNNWQTADLFLPVRSTSLGKSARKRHKPSQAASDSLTNDLTSRNTQTPAPPNADLVPSTSQPETNHHPNHISMDTSRFDPLASTNSVNSVSSNGSSASQTNRKKSATISSASASGKEGGYLPPLPRTKHSFVPRSPSSSWSERFQEDSQKRRRRLASGLGRSSSNSVLDSDEFSEEEDGKSETKSYTSSFRQRSSPSPAASTSSLPTKVPSMDELHSAQPFESLHKPVINTPPQGTSARLRPRLEARVDRMPRPTFLSQYASAPDQLDLQDEDDSEPDIDRRPSRQLLSLAAALEESALSKTPAVLPSPTAPPRISSTHTHSHSKSLSTKPFRRRSGTAPVSVPSSPETPRFSTASPPGSPQQAHLAFSSPSLRVRRPTRSGGWTVDVFVWAKLPPASLGMSQSASTGSLADLPGSLHKNPSIRDVPAAMRRKVIGGGRRESAQALAPPPPTVEWDAKKVKGTSSAASSFTYGPTGTYTQVWGWRKAEALLKDSGLLTITTTDDQMPLHSIPVSLLIQPDIAFVHPSLFGRTECLSLRIVTTRPAITPIQDPWQDLPRSPSGNPTKSNPFFLPFNLSRSHSDHAAPNSAPKKSIETEDFVYLNLPSKPSLQAFYVLLKTYAEMEPIRPISPARASIDVATDGAKALPHQPLSMLSVKTETPTFRYWRNIELTVCEGRNVGEHHVRSSIDHQKAQLGTYRSSSSTDNFGTSSIAGNISSGTPQVKKLPHAPKQDNHQRDKPEDSSGPTSVVSTFCEVAFNNIVIGRTTSKRGGPVPFWREAFILDNLPAFQEGLQIRLYQTQIRKGHLSITLLGIVDLPIRTFSRGTWVEQWFPAVVPDSENAGSEICAGELSLRVKVEELAVLPPEEYQELNQLLRSETDTTLIYDLAAGSLADLESTAEMFLRIFLAQGNITRKIKRMIDVEIDGDEHSANILFRGNSILTKLLELYIRFLLKDTIASALGELVSILCSNKVEVEIDPAKLSPGQRLHTNVADLNHWTKQIWNLIYLTRSKCPNELRDIFSYIQTVVVERYPDSATTMKYTSISAFFFLRFFVPALLNPLHFGLTATQPEPKCQRTLTLIAKSLQGLANVSKFGAKEPYMSVMNPFLEDNTAVFIDFIHHVCTPIKDTKASWQSPDFELYQYPLKRREAQATPLGKDAIPILPNALDLTKELALLASLLARSQQHSLEDERPSKSSADLKGTTNPNISLVSTLAVQLHEKANLSSCGHDGGILNEVFATTMSRSTTQERLNSLAASIPSSQMSTIETNNSDVGILTTSPSGSNRYRSQTVSSATPTRLIPALFGDVSPRKTVVSNTRPHSPSISTFKQSIEIIRSVASSPTNSRPTSIYGTHENNEGEEDTSRLRSVFRRK